MNTALRTHLDQPGVYSWGELIAVLRKSENLTKRQARLEINRLIHRRVLIRAEPNLVLPPDDAFYVGVLPDREALHEGIGERVP